MSDSRQIPASSETANTQVISLQDTSQDIWSKKYCLRDANGKSIDKNISDSFKRIAKALANIESDRRDFWYQEFLWALEHGTIPAGRIMSNLGAKEYKPATSTINCTVSKTLQDSMEDILQGNLEAGLTLKAGCGIGYEFSTLRPKGAFVSGAGAYTSGPLSFMDIYDKMCATVSSAGGRRGAQMATFDIHHPDVEDFIAAKREDGRLRQFNLSLLINDDFIQAVKNKQQWPLSFPLSKSAQKELELTLSDTQIIHWRTMPHLGSEYIRDPQGRIACHIYRHIKAEKLWHKIMRSTYDYAEPGFILIDRVNEFNNLWFCESIRASNPCGEQPLPPYGSCLLGSINLSGLVRNPFKEDAHFDWPQYRRLIRVFTRMLDNVVEENGLALAQQKQEILRKRRHGMGFLGLGSAMTMLKMPYGSPESLEFTEQVSRELALEGWREGVRLAKEKGAAPIFEEDFVIDESLLKIRPQLKEKHSLGDKVKGKALLARYSRYMNKIESLDPQLISDIAEFGCRFSHHSSVAPTGTIALSFGNNTSNGIEPSFAHRYSRNIIEEGKKSKVKTEVYSYEFLNYLSTVDPDADTNNLPVYFTVADEVSPKQHIDVQAAAQNWIDSSISKTINVPTDMDYEEFKDIYLYAHKKGLKGCTTFRFNPEAFQGVLVKDQDLQNTVYCFQLEDGSEVKIKGDETVLYDGEEHSAANLFDALKEGYYGKL
ncbi:adenosylcobalamin-dependent ribonucleoside-diphosphate reductase [uncultured Pseudoteredinibacter sp.]|uniref:adenosylcobalamin-dependent ribonucleoside-diphosphate reductase n=1 Tax=uncultured Pseudoteredinibacter sp. TaxID=1641701 RepID=UPI0026049456|nr:adenosylcobalamin-dependent ribonucleoside-diphosphate reductase [uncultured Pseudoteredinibacter sp.]